MFIQSHANNVVSFDISIQRDTSGLTVENSELKLRLQATEQQVHLQDGMGPTCLLSFVLFYWLYLFVFVLLLYFDVRDEAEHV